MRCSSCGYELPDDSKFCQYCGRKLSPAPEHANGETAAVSNDASIGTSQISAGAQAPSNADAPLRQKRTAYNAEEPTPAVYNRKAAYSSKPEQPENSAPVRQKRRRYCKYCGGFIDAKTKKCTSCGKQYFKVKLNWIPACLFIIFILAAVYIGYNYYSAVESMNNREFIKSQQFFDNLLADKTHIFDKYDYVKAGVLMEEGKYIESFKAFQRLSGVPVPVTIMDSLKSKIYSAGQTAYASEDFAEADKYFTVLGGYKRSLDYCFLIDCSRGSFLSQKTIEARYDELLQLLGFENADEIILKHESSIKRFLEGRWEDGARTNPLFFELQEESDGGWHSRYNLPHKDAAGGFFLTKATYSVGEIGPVAVKYFRFSIMNEDTISVYCFKNGSTHTLYRQ